MGLRKYEPIPGEKRNELPEVGGKLKGGKKTRSGKKAKGGEGDIFEHEKVHPRKVL